jgi:putative ABC transport system permease protein
MFFLFTAFYMLYPTLPLFIKERGGSESHLIKGNKKSKGEPKTNIYLTILALFLMGIGYAAALLVKGTLVIVAMLPVIIVVIIGTYLLFTQLSVYVIRRFKQNDNIFWWKTNMILLSDLSFRMKDNARTFFMVAIVSTVAFSAIGTLFGFQTFLTAGLKNNNPYTFSYTAVDQEEQDVAFINESIREENIAANHEQTILTFYENGQDSILIARESDFNSFAMLLGEDTIDIQDGQVKVVEFAGNEFGQTEELLQEKIELNSGVTLLPEEVIYSRALPATDSYYVVSDQDFEELPAPLREELYHAWQVSDGEENIVAASRKIMVVLPPTEFIARDYSIYQINKQYGLVLFVGLFIGIVFFVSAGSFLYFRLYADLDEDKQKFHSIAKMGLTEKELKKVLTRQTAILFFTPILVALIHGAVALTALSHLFYYDLTKVSIAVLGVFLLIQILYFYIVRFFYTKQVKTVL